MPFVQSGFEIEVCLELPYTQACSQFALYRVAIEQDNGGTTLRCGRDNLEAFAAMLLSLGCRIVVREPQELKGAFASVARRAIQTSEGSYENASAAFGQQS
jgi:hypothetical protein